jgi:hypothetical protein
MIAPSWRQTKIARGLAIAAAAATVALPGLAAAQEAIGINAGIRNQVQMRRGAAPPRPAVLRQRVALNDEVRTGAASQLQILLLDRSVFTIGANARLTVDRFVYDPRRSVRSVSATVTRGAFRFISGRSLAPGANSGSIRTPVATIGIRGTIVEGVVGADAVRIALAEAAVGPRAGGDPETATLVLLRGPGAQAQGGIRAGAIDVATGDTSVPLERPRLALYIPGPGLAAIGPFVISDAGLLALEQLLRPDPSAAAMPVGGSGQGPESGGDATQDGAPRGFGQSVGGWLPPLGVALGGLLLLLLSDSGDKSSSPNSQGDRPVSP